MVYHSTVCSEVLSPHWLEHHQGEVGDHNAGEGDVEGGGGAVDDVDYPVLFDVKRVADGPAIIGSGKLYDLCRIWVCYLKRGNFAPLHIPMKSSVSMDQVITPASPWS